MRNLRILLPLLLTVVLPMTSAACSSAPAAALPDGPGLLTRSAEAMKTVKTVTFTIETEGKPPVRVRRASGDLTREGDAQGTIQIEVLGNLQELAFVLSGDTVYFKGPTGGYQTMTRAALAQLYDPSALLDPDRGVAKLLASASDARTESAEKIGGADAYRVAATLSQQVLAPLLPGVAQGVNGELWIDKAGGRLLKADLPLGVGDAKGTVTVTLTDYDVPITIKPPAS
ncbi:MAG TPA: LppX_LprAFG lipoprotein [Thermopolyspora sp.]